MTDPVVYFLNTNGVILFIVAVFAYLWFLMPNREVFWHALLVFTITLITTVVLKELFLRPRPFVELAQEPMAGLTLFSSFPSAHAALAFCLATLIVFHNRRLGVFLFLISTLIALGRVAAGVHYLSDIAFGILTGVLVALFFNTAHIKFKKKRLTK